MAGRLAGKRAFVTAAGAGIGRAIAAAYVAEGADVIATDIDEAALDALWREIPGVATRVLDVTDSGALAVALAEAGPITTLVNAAGWVHHGALLDCDEAAWARSVELNVTPMYRACRMALPGLIERGGGSIVNVASVVSSLKAAANRFAYMATKAAVIGLTKSIAFDYVGRGIRANAICPGTIDTPSLGQRIAAFDDPEAARKAFVARQPMGRFGTAVEVAALAVYLASDESAFTTGVAHVLDGAMSL